MISPSVPAQPEPPDAMRRLLQLTAADIAYFHAILEGYDDLATMRTIAPDEGLVEVYVSPGSENTFDELLQALREEGVAICERRDEG